MPLVLTNILAFDRWAKNPDNPGLPVNMNNCSKFYTQDANPNFYVYFENNSGTAFQVWVFNTAAKMNAAYAGLLSFVAADDVP